jgi:hypothetical protein
VISWLEGKHFGIESSIAEVQFGEDLWGRAVQRRA